MLVVDMEVINWRIKAHQSIGDQEVQEMDTLIIAWPLVVVVDHRLPSLLLLQVLRTEGKSNTMYKSKSRVQEQNQNAGLESVCTVTRVMLQINVQHTRVTSLHWIDCMNSNCVSNV